MTEKVILGWQGVMVECGLGSPMARGMCAAMLAGVASYALKYPRRSFRRDGTLRPSATLGSTSQDATDLHYLLTPLAVGSAVCLFT